MFVICQKKILLVMIAVTAVAFRVFKFVSYFMEFVNSYIYFNQQLLYMRTFVFARHGSH